MTMVFTRLPILIALPAFMMLFAAIAVATHAIFRRFVPPAKLSEQYDVAGFLVSVVGVLYSVVLGLLVGTVWTGFSTAQQTTDLEAGYVADAFNYAAQLPHGQGRAIQRLIAQYAIEVRDVEWPMLEQGQSDPRAQSLLTRAVASTVALAQPKTTSSSAVLEINGIRTEILDNLRNVGDTRRLRFLQARSHLPPGMLEALILGAVLVTAFALFFGVRSFLKQMAMTALIAGAIGLFFGLIVELSTPYSGAVQVSRDAWTFVIQNNHFADVVK
jgi:hypothetical protein